MQEWQIRILVERCELYIKIVQLGLWLRGDNYEAELEKRQLEIMEEYLTVLDDRVERFE